MTHLAKLKAVAAASAAVAAMLSATPANAYVYAVSHANISNLNIGITDALGNVTPATVNSYTFNQSNSASMNGGPSASSAACNSFGFPACNPNSPVLDAAAVNAAGSSHLRVNNDFTLIGNGVNGSYSGADSVIHTAQLVQGLATGIEQIAESLLNSNGFAQANALQQSNTSLTTTFNLNGNTSNLFLSFLATVNQQSAINGLLGDYLSQSDLNVSFTLSGNGGSVSWTPNGTAANDCFVTGALVGAVTCAEFLDEADLNRNTTTSDNPGLDDNSFAGASFSMGIFGLQQGTYSLALNAQTSTSIIRRVPEPGALALLGIAMAGLAFTTRRQGRKQA